MSTTHSHLDKNYRPPESLSFFVRLGVLLALFAVSACADLPQIVIEDDDGSTATGGAPAVDDDGSIGDDSSGNGGSAPLPDPDAICGNGLLEIGELCDDGNTRDGDGCSADCLVQDPEFDCSIPGRPCVDTVVCGNARLEGNEVCDDENTISGDGCSADCLLVEDGWFCPRPGEPCVELPVCGNGVRERGENCDDGNVVSGDGCSGNDLEGVQPCQREDGFFCPTPGSLCLALVCGDGTRTPNEACDDNNLDDGDGCSSQCEVEPGFRCSASGCRAICGDGLVVDDEECDDNNRISGDGCSAACREEPFYSCSGEPSSCVSTIECGNSILEPGEICDPPSALTGCLPGCASFAPEGSGSICPNGVIEIGETCDPPDVGNGCSLGCAVEPGWTCPLPGVCFRLPSCGDGILQANEGCDVGPVSTSGCIECNVQPGWFCYGAEPSVCEQSVCGDGILAPDEECDDNNDEDDDGCTACMVDDGWICPTAGEDCFPRCGDGIITGDEECDDGNRINDDGCNAACRVEPGFSCPDEGEECIPAVCGNGITEPGEGCDFGDTIAGDGCGPTCQLEPTVTVGPNPVVHVTCGDGLKTGSEQCDDGNTTPGDGCSASCQIETGFTCSELLDLPGQVQIQTTFRDFKSGVGDNGHPDFQYGWLNHVPGIAGVPCTTDNPDSCGRLDGEGKPALVVDNQATTGIMNADTFGLWFRNGNPTNVAGFHGVIATTAAFVRPLTLTQLGGITSETYQFDSVGNFFPIGPAEGFGAISSDAPLCCIGDCDSDSDYGVACTTNCGDPGCNTCVEAGCADDNYSFTTELRYFFQYKGGETLSFRGDDDVWVFINGRLAVDIGGLHSILHGRVVLGDDGIPSGGDSDCSAHAVGSVPDECELTEAEEADGFDDRFDLEIGGVYEIVLFHAERHTNASNFQLTLSGFIAPRSYCEPTCGDEQIVGWEVCDDGSGEGGNSNSVYGACNTTCTGRTFCGDGVRQGPSDTPVSGPEACDNGRNLDTRATGLPNQCAPGCLTPTSCGDGFVQAVFEQCDNGASNDDASYGPDSCTTGCALGGYCGDGVQNGPEACDYAAPSATTYGEGSCGYDCQPGPFCGDGVRNGPEECDNTENCSANCTLQPFCGDGLVSAGAGESCDYAQFASNDYGGCTATCEWGPLCGDNDIDEPFEECDDGVSGNTGGYDECTAACTLGPHCGDALVQSEQGELCDNGFNDDAYEYDENACASQCTRPPHCGDGTLQSAFELCDEGASNSDTAYNGCNTSCEWGPYCGDGTRDTAFEECDAGPNNVAYGASPGACGYDCKLAPYCGDGTRNGPEQCDLGAGNTGAYGGCTATCTLAPRCGDGIVQANAGEQCDAGPTGSLTCTPDCKNRDNIK